MKSLVKSIGDDEVQLVEPNYIDKMIETLVFGRDLCNDLKDSLEKRMTTLELLIAAPKPPPVATSRQQQQHQSFSLENTIMLPPIYPKSNLICC